MSLASIPRQTFYRALAGSAAVVVIAAHVPGLVYGTYANVDEAYASALGERLLEGFSLYRGAISQRGPLMYYLYAALDAGLGWDSVRGVRVMGLAFALAHVGLVWAIGRRLFGEACGAVAALLCAYAVTVGFYPWDGLALNGEVLQVPLVLGGVLFCGLSRGVGRLDPTGRTRRTRRLVAAGLSFGLAAAIKQSALSIPLAVLPWLCADALLARPRMRGALDAIAFVSAVALPAGVFLAHAALAGTLRDLWFYCVTFNLGAHRAEGGRFADWYRPLYEHLRTHTAYFLLVAVAFATTAARLRRAARYALRRRVAASLSTLSSMEVCVGLCAFGALGTAAALPQHFGHYYVTPLPLLALTATSTLASPLQWARVEGRVRMVLVAAAVVLAAYCGIFVYETADGRALVSHDERPLATAAYVEQTTSPQDKVFVWGFSPWIYGYSHRRAAGRYLFETYVTGFVPLMWADLPREPSRVVPGSMQVLLDDLDRERPVLVVDAGSIMMARPIRAYAPAASWLREHYCFDARVGAADVYRRKQDGAACPSAFFPCPSPATDHFGGPLWVPVPQVADSGPSTLLPPGPPDVPIRLSDDATAIACH